MGRHAHQSQWLIDKTEAVAANGMVATKHPLASRVGVDVLRMGGNAVDAAVAAAFAAGVVEPWMSGLGGGGFLVVHSARDQRTRVFDFSMRAPLAAHPAMYPLGEGLGGELFPWRSVEGRRNAVGYQAIAVPGTPAGLALALQEAGTMDLATVLQPAIRLAEEGFPVDWYTTLQIAADAETIAGFPETARVFFAGGFPRPPGDGPALPLLEQPDLARTLRMLADEGVDALYRGSLARRIVTAMREHDGLITEEDLAGYRPLVAAPGEVAVYQGVTVVASTPPSGGPAVAAMLRALDAAGPPEAGHNSVSALHAFAEAARPVLEDRFARHGPRPGTAAGVAAREGSTTHLAVVDRDRSMVSLTQTLLSRFGSRVTIPGTGILMNNGMLWFDPEPGRPNSVRGGARPLANMAPVLLLAGGRPLATVGASGGRRIMCAIAQICVNLVAHGLGIQRAISAPRIDVSTGPLLADSRLPERVLEGLRRLGHEVVPVEESFHPRQFASPVGILVDQVSGVLSGGADPFHPAICIGY